MKSLIIFTLLLMPFLSFAIHGKNVPAKVKEVVYKKYYNTYDMSWSKDRGLYVCAFKQGMVKRYMYMEKDGTLVMCESHISSSDLPEVVSQHASGQFIKHVISYETPDDSYYYIQAKSKGFIHEYWIDSNGDIREHRAVNESNNKKIGAVIIGIVALLFISIF